MSGLFYTKECPYGYGWKVLRVSEENPGSWDRLILAGLTESKARAVAAVLNTEE